MNYENSLFSIETKLEPGCKVTHKVKVTPAQVKKAYQKAVKKINKEISIPGFRKGRAPDSTVISKYGSYVDQEWKEIVVNDAFRAALELSEIYPFKKEAVQKPKIDQCSLEEGAIVTLSYESYPEIPKIDFSTLEIPSIERVLITDERVEEMLAEVQRSHMTFEPIEGRPAQEGDFVDVTIDAIDEEPPKNIVKDRRFEVDDKRMGPWLKKLLIGLEVGQSIEGMSEVDPSADEATKDKFKPTHVRITLHSLQKASLPQIDDELGKKAGASSKEDLIDKVRARLENEADEEMKQKQFAALETALLEAYPFDLPNSLVAPERQAGLKRALQELKNQNLSDEEIKAQEGAITEKVAHDVDAALRLYFLEKQIVKQGDLSLTNEELNNEYVRQIVQNPYFYGREMDDKTSRELVSRLASDMLRRKAQEFALSQILTSQKT